MRLIAFGGVRGRGLGRARERAVAGTVAGMAVAVLLSAPASAEHGEASTPSTGGDGGGFDAALVELALSGSGRSPLRGEEFTYRATVVNEGDTAVENGLLAQHLPEPLEVVDVDQGGMLEEGVANWRVDVPPGGEAVYTVRVRVSEEVPGEERVVSTACLLLEREADPSACASEALLVAESTMFARVGQVLDRETLVGTVGVGALMMLLWLLWRRWGVPNGR
ncbi:hypothetical protein [Nocardiopsis alkaliphila]|uniref:hypothetical protein n=1 Tax=Nocardiopsis alkaliphila TaxID=225762 RepID=UPI00034DE4CE|nr:hypothetical protein [Nocardiopsis alkaliphila]